jgi:hypothetical protein
MKNGVALLWRMKGQLYFSADTICANDISVTAAT